MGRRSGGFVILHKRKFKRIRSCAQPLDFNGRPIAKVERGVNHAHRIAHALIKRKLFKRALKCRLDKRFKANATTQTRTCFQGINPI